MNTDELYFFGVDPGEQGALAILRPDRTLDIFDLSASLGDVANTICAVFDALAEQGVRRRQIIGQLEFVGSMPKQGLQSTFNFGKSVGVVMGALYACRIGFDVATPQTWKAAVYDAEAKRLAKKDQKAASRDRARRLFPDEARLFARVKDDGRAEAALIAEFARLKYLGRLPARKTTRDAWEAPRVDIDPTGL